VSALRGDRVPLAGVPAAMGWPHDAARARRVLAGLVADGLVALDGDDVRLS
jgi:hypothetical protein